MGNACNSFVEGSLQLRRCPSDGPQKTEICTNDIESEMIFASGGIDLEHHSIRRSAPKNWAELVAVLPPSLSTILKILSFAFVFNSLASALLHWEGQT